MIEKIFLKDELRVVLTPENKKQGGISLVLKEKFLIWQQEGRIIDRDGNNIFDKSQEEGLAEKLGEIHAKMKPSDWAQKNSFDYTEEQMLELLDKAGYDLVQKK